MSKKTRITRTIATATFEAKALSILLENIDGVHTHVRNGESFKGKQKDCPLCKNGSEFEKSFGAIGAS